MSDKHTPGMWAFDKRPSDFRVRVVVQTGGGLVGKTTICRVTKEADARLIAAAPDLLAAVWKLLQATDDEERRTARLKAFDAIVKATGGTA